MDETTVEMLETDLYDIWRQVKLIDEEIEMLKKRKAWLKKMERTVKRDIRAAER